MIGDKLVIEQYHTAAADYILKQMKKMLAKVPFSITISGESGSGKSEIAHVLQEQFQKQDYKVIVLGQDDYFKLPPHSNHEHRKKDISWVGTGEVKLNLLDSHLSSLLSGNGVLEKPLVNFEKDSIGKETLIGPYDIVIAEGTYTALLKNADIHVFIDRNYHETKKHRLKRNRDQALEQNSNQDLEFLENVLEIEHQIISAHKQSADLIVPPPSELLAGNK